MKYLTIQQALKELTNQLPITAYTLRKGLRSGRFKTTLVGGRYMVDPDLVLEDIQKEMLANQQRAAIECSAEQARTR